MQFNGNASGGYTLSSHLGHKFSQTSLKGAQLVSRRRIGCRAFDDGGSPAMTKIEPTFRRQYTVGFRDGIEVYCQIGGDAPDGWQGTPGSFVPDLRREENRIVFSVNFRI